MHGREVHRVGDGRNEPSGGERGWDVEGGATEVRGSKREGARKGVQRGGRSNTGERR